MENTAKNLAKGAVNAVLTKIFLKLLAGFLSLAVALWVPILAFFVVVNVAAYYQWDLTQRAENSSSTTCISTVAVENDSSATVNVPEEYRGDIDAAAEESGVPAQTIAAQIQAESNWNAQAVSPAGARGIAQFMPATWESIAPGEDPFDPHAGIRALGRYMSQLKKQVEHLAGGDANKLIELTLAAYNAGPGNVLEFGGIPPFVETQNYVEKIMRASQMVYSKDCSQVGSKVWDGDLGPGEWTNPCPGCVKTSSYQPRNLPVDAQNGYFHWGIDLATPGAGMRPGTQIIAPTKMRITDYFDTDGCLFATAADDGPDFGFSFCHLHEVSVSVGTEVEKGTVLGVEGGTGGGVKNKFATHLHFEMYAPGFDYKNFNWFSARSGADNHGGNLNPEPILIEKGAMPGL